MPIFPENEIESWLRTADKNGDGRIDIDEFTCYMVSSVGDLSSVAGVCGSGGLVVRDTAAVV